MEMLLATEDVEDEADGGNRFPISLSPGASSISRSALLMMKAMSLNLVYH